MPDENRYLGVALSGLQNIYEFRVGTGRILGVRVEAGTRVRQDTRIVADAAIYSHRLSNGAMGADWSQRRVSARLGGPWAGIGHVGAACGTCSVMRILAVLAALMAFAMPAGGQGGGQESGFPHPGMIACSALREAVMRG
jgi:hypothetical protein